MKSKKSETLFRITHLGKLVATIIRVNHIVKDVEFVTNEQESLQVGLHNKKSGISLTPHIHLSNTKVINEIQEVLYVVKGKIRVTLYTIDGDVIDTVDLTAGDCIVQKSMGHGVEILEDAKIFEVKQGPYPGTQHAKIFLDKKHDSCK